MVATEHAAHGLSLASPPASKLGRELTDVASAHVLGRVRAVTGMVAELEGLAGMVRVGDRLWLGHANRDGVMGEVIACCRNSVRVMTFNQMVGFGPGDVAAVSWAPHRASHSAKISPSVSWLGRVIDPLGRPLDDKGSLRAGSLPKPVQADPPSALERGRLGPRIDLGVTAIDLFTTCREGQRLGLFAGPGVGKSTLLGMLARNTTADVTVLALVGERGREVREFLEGDLGADGLKRSVVICATSDSNALMRREAAYTAMAIAEYFRDENKSVLLMMDSVTRFCLALREIGLSAGELPAARGFPPSVFAELPRLLERAGPGIPRQGRGGQITAMFTVLVEGDDQTEPVADAVRGILDGHVVLDRRIAEMGRYPAVDVLRSLSRLANSCLTPDQKSTVQRARDVLATHAEIAELLRLGAYKPGTDAQVDRALRLQPRIEKLLCQDAHETCAFDASFVALSAALQD